MKQVIRAYWWNDQSNLGDRLTPLLLETFGFGVTRVGMAEADVCVVGSILDALPVEFCGAILGSGFIQAGPRRSFPRATCLAFRGPLSAARAGKPEAPVGDPGLLCPRLVADRPRNRGHIGLVPHYKDKYNDAVRFLAERFPGDVTVIDVQAEPILVLRRIAECRAVLSSSLHGLIAADAFGIPSSWIELSDAVIGGGYKFRDYMLSMGATPRASALTGSETLDDLLELTSIGISDLRPIRETLNDAFCSLSRALEFRTRR